MRFDHVVVGLDFDGTIAPIVDHPDLAVANPRTVRALETLASMPGVDVVIVSGRPLADLRERLGDVPGVILIGEHGNDTGAAEARPEIIEEATRVVTALGQRTPGAMVEVKKLSVTFHTRRVAEPLASEALETLRSWASQHDEITVLEGKEVLELSVGSRTKGDAIGDFGADADAVVFIGDDKTDETVFERLTPGDVGVKVGEGDTAARYRVSTTADVAELLERIISKR